MDDADMEVSLLLAWMLAHSWYEPACCSEYHCHPVVDGVVNELSDGVEIVGYGKLHYEDARLRWSRDGRDHICTTQSKKILCVYRKMKTT
jgi:hypothetical protein